MSGLAKVLGSKAVGRKGTLRYNVVNRESSAQSGTLEV
jgi:hypothetical protein